MGFSFFKPKNRGKQKLSPEVAAGLNGERSSNPQVSIKLAEHFLREGKRELGVDEYLNAAELFLEKRQTQLAMAVYRNIITIDPERYSVYETLADLYLKGGFPGDGASVLLALAYQYKTAGCDSEVKRVLDSVLEFAPNNPVLKRKVQTFLAAEGKSGTAAPAKAPEPGPQAAAQKPSAPAPAETSVFKPVSPAAEKAPEPGPAAAAQKPSAPAEPEAPGEPARSFFDLQSALTTAVSPEQKSVLAQPKEPDHRPEVSTPPTAPAEPDEPDAKTRPFFDLQSALATDVASGQKSAPAHPNEPATKPDVSVQSSKFARESDISARQSVAPVSPVEAAAKPVVAAGLESEPDATAQSFFDLQAALATDASLGFDYDASLENMANTDQEGSPFSVLNVVKDIALHDPRQDTPLFHFNLGIAYMQCGDYEQAVDELLNALYGIPDKIGCYVRLAECSLKLQRRELACGFLREALDEADIDQDQAGDVRKRLEEISAG